MVTRALVWLIPAVCAGITAPARADYVVTSGVNWSAGRYGEAERTTIFDTPVSVKWTSKRVALGVSTDVLRISGPADVVLTDRSPDGQQRPELIGRSPGRSAQSGLGDTGLMARYTVTGLAGSPFYLEGTARLRLPTGSRDRGLGTGVVDGAVQLETGAIGKTGGAYVMAGRRFLSDLPDVERHDGWQASVGGWIAATPRLRVGADHDWRRTSVAGGTDPAEVDAYLSYRCTGHLRAQLMGTAGLSRASADLGLGLTMIWSS